MRLLDPDASLTPVSSRGPLVLPLADPRASLALVGGKAFGLAGLAQAGFPVPPAAVVTTAAFETFVHEAMLTAELQLLTDVLRPTSALPSEAILSTARARIRAAAFPASLREELTARVGEQLDAGLPLAVRSSATAEDLGEASFAGLYETHLNVRGHEAVERAIKRCWASMWTLRVIDYLRRGGHLQCPAMAVLLQRLVEAEISGVVFTANPITGLDDEAVVEAVFGLGEPLVSGRSAPDRYVADLWTGKLRSAHLGLKTVKAVAAGDDGIREETVGIPQARSRTLDEPTLARVVALAADVQEHAGRPMDLEFALERDTLLLLQARPITQIHFAPALGEWTNANFREGGVAASECTLLMSSLYERAFNVSMQRYLAGLGLIPRQARHPWLRTFFGRPYWNFGAVKQAIGGTPGFVERNFDLDLGIPVTYPGEGRTTPMGAASVLRSLPTVVALDRGYGRNLEAARAFVAAFPSRRAALELSPQALSQLSAQALAAGFRQLVDGLHQSAETLYFTTVYNLSNAKLELSLSLAEAGRKGGIQVSYPRLMGGLKDVSHLRPLRELHRLAARLHTEHREATEAEMRDFAARWPHKGHRELDLRVPRWSEEPAQIRQLIDTAVAVHGLHPDPDLLAEQQHREYLAERARAEQSLGRAGRWLFRRRLDRVRALSWWREELRDCSTYVYLLVRRWTLEAGRRLVERGVLSEATEGFNLTAEELFAALEGQAGVEPLRESAARQRRILRAFRNFTAPHEVGARYGYRWTAQPVGPAPRSRAGSVAFTGTASSPGVVEGLARVIQSMEEAHSLQPGEILVARFTDPGWTPALARCAGVVTESGGLLSHAAVISREYGIPAVLAVDGVTLRIRTGQHVRVDGDLGRIEVSG